MTYLHCESDIFVCVILTLCLGGREGHLHWQHYSADEICQWNDSADIVAAAIVCCRLALIDVLQL